MLQFFGDIEQMANIVTRLYNSTLGLPQQLMYRLMRLMKDDEVGVLDKEGFADPGLIPILGAFADHEKDAFGEDFTGDAWSGFAMDVALDPVTYMSWGLSAAGKAGQAMKKAGNSLELAGQATQVNKLGNGHTVDEFVTAAQKALEKGIKDPRTENRIKEAVNLLGPHLGKTSDALLKEGKEEVLMWAVPLLRRLGLEKQVNTAHTSWFKLAGSHTSKFAGIASSPLRGIIHAVPVLDKWAERLVTAPIKGLSAGLSSKATPGLKVEYSHLDTELAEDAHSMLRSGRQVLTQKLEKRNLAERTSGTLFEERFDKHLRQGQGDPEQHRKRAFLNALGYKAPKNVDALDTKVAEIADHLTGQKNWLPETGEELNDAIHTFSTKFDESKQLLNDASTHIVPVQGESEKIRKEMQDAGNDLAYALFKTGKRLRATWHKWFQSDIPIEGTEKLVKTFNNDIFSASEKGQEYARTLGQLMAKESQERDIPVEQIRQLINSVFEGTTGIEEINLLRHSGGTPEEMSKVGGMFENHLARMETSLDVLGNILHKWGVKGAEDFKTLVGEDGLLAQGARLYDDQSIAKRYAQTDPHNNPSEAFADASDINYRRRRTVVDNKTGEVRDGEYFGWSTTDELQQEVNSIRTSIKRKIGAEELLSDQPVFRRALDDYNVSPEKAHLFINALKRAKEGTLKKFLGRPLTENEIKRFEALADSFHKDLNFGRVTDYGLLDPAEFKYLRDTEELIRLRKDPKVTSEPLDGFIKEKSKRIEVPDTVGPRPFDGPLRNEAGKFASHSALGRAFVGMHAANQEIKRVVKYTKKYSEGLEEAPELVTARLNAVVGDDFSVAAERLALAAEDMDAAVLEVVHNGLGKHGKALIDELLDMRRKATKQSIQLGMDWSPGYLPRLLSPSGAKALRLLNSKADEDTLQKLMPQMHSSFPRDLTHLTLDEVNALAKGAVEIGEPELAKALDDVLKRENLVIKHEKFESDPISMLINHMGALQQRKTTSGLVDGLMEAKISGDTHMFGGRVVGWAVGEKYFVQKKNAATAKLKDHHVSVIGDEIVDEIHKTHILVESADGIIPISTTSAGAGGFSFLDMGDALYRKVRNPKTGLLEDQKLSSGQQYARRSMDTAMSTSKFRTVTPGTDPEWINSLMGKEIIFGNGAAVGAIHNTVSKQFAVAGDTVRAFDSANTFLRKFQTVLRPAFHVQNLISGMFQGGMLGTSAKDVLTGHVDATRFLFRGNDDLMQASESLSAMLGKHRIVGSSGKLTRGTGMVRVLRRVGSEGKVVTDAELKDAGLEHLIDMVFELGDGQVIPARTIIEEAAKGGLFGTFFARGFAGAASTPEGMSKFLQKAMGKKGYKGDVAEELSYLEKAEQSGALEMSEIVSRFGTLFGRIRTHGDLTRAVAESQKAMVNYADLTNFERKYMKRMFLYYTFPRKFTPFAFEQFSKSPRSLGLLSKAIEDLGAVSIEGGNVSLNLETPGVNNIELNVQRLNAAIDSAMVLPAIYERLLPSSDLRAPFNPPMGGQFGGVAGIFLGGEPFDPGAYSKSDHWMKDAMNATYATKWLMNGVQDIAAATGASDTPGELDMLDEMARFLVPVKSVEKGYHFKRVLKYYRRLRVQLESQINEPGPAWRREALVRQLRSLTAELPPALEAEL